MEGEFLSQYNTSGTILGFVQKAGFQITVDKTQLGWETALPRQSHTDSPAVQTLFCERTGDDKGPGFPKPRCSQKGVALTLNGGAPYRGVR